MKTDQTDPKSIDAYIFYPTPAGTDKFKQELSIYEGAKGSIRFPLDRPMPFALIRKIVKFRVKENLERAKAKQKK